EVHVAPTRAQTVVAAGAPFEVQDPAAQRSGYGLVDAQHPQAGTRDGRAHREGVPVGEDGVVEARVGQADVGEGGVVQGDTKRAGTTGSGSGWLGRGTI